MSPFMDRGVDDCPERGEGLGHVWAGTDPEKGGDSRNSCRFCKHPGRDNVFENESGGYFAEATAARAELFSRLRQPASVKQFGKQS